MSAMMKVVGVGVKSGGHFIVEGINLKDEFSGVEIGAGLIINCF